ncbi:hypothetical protein K456DRAFT_1537582 [Colletotrichum gloeosporioides 23]|nr:hypothetical protein K456DRAFT_1537582 [Colletotrichum gloeosporioides 23]
MARRGSWTEQQDAQSRRGREDSAVPSSTNAGGACVTTPNPTHCIVSTLINDEVIRSTRRAGLRYPAPSQTKASSQHQRVCCLRAWCCKILAVCNIVTLQFASPRRSSNDATGHWLPVQQVACKNLLSGPSPAFLLLRFFSYMTRPHLPQSVREAHEEEDRRATKSVRREQEEKKRDLNDELTSFSAVRLALFGERNSGDGRLLRCNTKSSIPAIAHNWLVIDHRRHSPAYLSLAWAAW